MSEARARARAVVEQIESRLPGGVEAALVYGSAARDEYRAGGSDVNLLVILRKLGADELAAVSGLLEGWMAEGNPPPLLMSAEEWRCSADVFPIEYADVLESHLVVAGAAPFEGIRVDQVHLWHQAEYEARAKLIQLREGLLAAGADSRAVGDLLCRSLAGFLALFRAALLLAERPIPATSREVMEELAAELKVSPAPLLTVLRARDQESDLDVQLTGSLVRSYLDVLGRLVTWLDARGGGVSSGGIVGGGSR